MQDIDRYIFCLNMIVEKDYIPVNELAKEIKQGLEFDKTFTIDRKTVQNIVNVLNDEKLV